MAATTGEGRQTHCIPHQAGKENKQQAHTPTTLTPATLPTHASPATARTPTTASALNSFVGESLSSPGSFLSHGARETEQGRRVISWAHKPWGREKPPPGLGSNHVPGQEQPGKGTSLTFHIRQRANVTLRLVELRGQS